MNIEKEEKKEEEISRNKQSLTIGSLYSSYVS